VGVKRVIVHIDRLVLKGFRVEDRDTISSGLQRELTGLLAHPQAVQGLASPGDSSRLKLGRIHVAQGSKPDRVGAQVAQRIGEGLKK